MFFTKFSSLFNSSRITVDGHDFLINTEALWTD